MGERERERKKTKRKRKFFTKVKIGVAETHAVVVRVKTIEGEA